jgi:hypothetical protein
MEMFAQLLGPRAVKTFADTGHTRAQGLQVGAAVVHSSVPVTKSVGPLGHYGDGT